jgi:hypothetical protein
LQVSEELLVLHASCYQQHLVYSSWDL